MPFDELMLVGLRRREGVPMDQLARAHGLSVQALGSLRRRLASFEESGLLRVEGPRWRLTDPAGLALSNAVLRELLVWWESPGR
jgi:oxygen-independent coproporphyrinogen-3 oxidase